MYELLEVNTNNPLCFSILSVKNKSVAILFFPDIVFLTLLPINIQSQTFKSVFFFLLKKSPALANLLLDLSLNFYSQTFVLKYVSSSSANACTDWVTGEDRVRVTKTAIQLFPLGYDKANNCILTFSCMYYSPFSSSLCLPSSNWILTSTGIFNAHRTFSWMTSP